MRFVIGILIFVFLPVSLIFGQDTSRQQKIEELKTLGAKIEQLQNQIVENEQRKGEIALEILAVSEEKRAEAKKLDAKAIRLFPDGVLDKLIPTLDEVGFSVYSFTEISDYYIAPRIEYKNNSLEFTDELKDEGNHGFIADIGKISLETITEQSREFVALAKYKSPTEIKDIKSEFASDGLNFRRSVAIAVEKTYLVRIVRYGEGDGIFAIKIQHKDTDGSIVIFIKTIKTFEPPKSKIMILIDEYKSQTKQIKIPDYETAQAVQEELRKCGFSDVLVEATSEEVTLRGTVPKGKMAEAVLKAHETVKRKILNQLTER